MGKPIRVLFVTAEAAPFIKVGGLGDVAGTLPHVLRRAGADIRMVLPLHHQIDRKRFGLEKRFEYVIPAGVGGVKAAVYETADGDLPVYLIDSPLMPDSGPLYSTDSAADGPKFVHFSLAALELARQLDFPPHVLHAQDWHTAAAVYALALRRDGDDFFLRTASLLTVHNLPYHGEGAAQALSEFGLPSAEGSALPWWSVRRPLALGLLAADHVNTVSEGYAAEMLTEEFGAGLHEFLRDHKAEALTGILNGLDLEAWNPETDEAIVRRYGAATLGDKAANKAALQKETGLPAAPKVPLFGIVSRMDEQKGIDLAIDALAMAADREWQAVVLGTGNEAIEAAARRLMQAMPDRVHVSIDFNADFGRRIYAGVDAFLIPSRYEPCGLTQMIAMRYGTVPVARAVGGLRDTIVDYDAGPGSTGILFGPPDPAALAAAIGRSLDLYADQRRWRGLQRRGMKQEFSWDASAAAYLELYRTLSSRRAAF